MKLTKYKSIHIGAIVTFYIIALLVRLISLLVVNKFSSIETNYPLQVSAALATGLGPAIGALVAMLIFKRRTEYTLIGKSAWKSIATIVIPCIVFGIIGGWDLGVTCLFAFAYGLLEEYGWRGFLQYELRELPMWQYVLIITMMWFLWHLDLNLRSILPFFLLLLFASWGIGKVVRDTHSLLFCAAFHGIVNFSKRDLFSDTTFTVTFICIIVFWIVMWYFLGISPKQQSREKNSNLVKNMNIEDYREYCLSLGDDVEEKLPFTAFHYASGVLVFYVAGHMFSFFNCDNFGVITLKCQPERIEELKARYDCIGKPFNESPKYWIGIDANTAPDDLLQELTRNSYEIVKAKYKKHG